MDERSAQPSGKVVDDTGEPMVGVNVTVLDKPSEEELEDAGAAGQEDRNDNRLRKGGPTIGASTASLDSSPAKGTWKSS